MWMCTLCIHELFLELVGGIIWFLLFETIPALSSVICIRIKCARQLDSDRHKFYVCDSLIRVVSRCRKKYILTKQQAIARFAMRC